MKISNKLKHFPSISMTHSLISFDLSRFPHGRYVIAMINRLLSHKFRNHIAIEKTSMERDRAIKSVAAYQMMAAAGSADNLPICPALLPSAPRVGRADQSLWCSSLATIHLPAIEKMGERTAIHREVGSAQAIN